MTIMFIEKQKVVKHDFRILSFSRILYVFILYVKKYDFKIILIKWRRWDSNPRTPER
jgi:hypothetical protein